MSNYIAILKDCSAYGMNKRKQGDKVYAHIYEDGKVLLFSPYNKKEKKPIFDVIFDSIEEVKPYATCIAKTDYDVCAAWGEVMSDRYW